MWGNSTAYKEEDIRAEQMVAEINYKVHDLLEALNDVDEATAAGALACALMTLLHSANNIDLTANVLGYLTKALPDHFKSFKELIEH